MFLKIRKATIFNETKNIYLYENKKEEYTLVAVPSIEWSTIIPYEEELKPLKERTLTSISQRVDDITASDLTNKILHWVREM